MAASLIADHNNQPDARLAIIDGRPAFEGQNRQGGQRNFLIPPRACVDRG